MLTNTQVRNAKPAEKPYKLSDFGGLYLLVNPIGSKLWRVDYRFGGKRRTAALGSFPLVGLADARKQRDEIKRHIKDGLDPAVVRQTERLQAQTAALSSFETIAREWFESRKTGWADSYSKGVIGRLETYIFPVIGRMQITRIEPPEMLAAIRKIEAAGAHEAARKALQTCGQVFRYAIASGRARTDPTRDLRGALKAPPPVRRHPTLKARDIPGFFANLDRYDGAETTRLGLELILRTMVRTGEARFAQWSEFSDLDGRDPLWRIPAERMKMSRDHLVPLVPQTVAILERLRDLACGNPYVFPAPTKTGVVSENTFLFALYRMGYHTRLTVHGFRGTASTILNEQGWNRDWIEVQLAHTEADDVRAAYNAAEYLPGRRKMLEWWNDYLDTCRETAILIG